MLLNNALQHSHELMARALKPGDRALDATAGNGKDTLHLARLIGSTGQVVAVDIQKQALDNTQNLLKKENLINQVQLIEGNHAQMDKLTTGPFQVAVFNLGYLPGGDHEIITEPESTLRALKKVMPMIRPGGLITLVAYHGHPGGKNELTALEKFLPSLDQKKVAVLQYSFINQAGDPPVLFALEVLEGADCPDR